MYICYSIFNILRTPQTLNLDRTLNDIINSLDGLTIQHIRLSSWENTTINIYLINSFIWLQEVWTLCRILKRDHTSCGKYTSNNWRMTTLNPKQSVAGSSSKTCSSESDATFGALAANDQSERSPLFNNVHTYEGNQFSLGRLSLNDDVNNPNSCMSFPNTPNEEMLTSNGNWDELRPMVDCVLNPSLLYSYM